MRKALPPCPGPGRPCSPRLRPPSAVLLESPGRAFDQGPQAPQRLAWVVPSGLAVWRWTQYAHRPLS